MRIAPESFFFPDGGQLTLRSPEPEEAAIFLDFLKQTAGETEFLLSYPDEVRYTTEEERAILQKYLDDDRAFMIAAFRDGEVVGNVSVRMVSPHDKLRHRARLAIGLRRDCWGRGLGTRLLRAAVETARGMGFVQLELGVFADNARALSLYEREGFHPWGTLPRAFRTRDGVWHDEVQMLLEL